MIAIIIALIVVAAAAYLIIKNYQPALVLLGAGLVLLFAAAIMGYQILDPETTTGFIWIDPFKQLQQTFVAQLGNVGLTVMVLFGFSTYMNHIGANEVAVQTMTKPLGRIKSKYLFIPIVFLLGNVLSLFIPSASSLAVILMAILYPLLKRLGINPLAAGAVIATTATIMPTPLGADNVIAAETLGYSLVDYVTIHASISIPILLIMAVAHYFWQKYLDKKDGDIVVHDLEESVKVDKTDLPPVWYGLLPMLPLVLILVSGIAFPEIKVNVVILTLISFVVALLIEVIRKRSLKKAVDDSFQMFEGMGQGFTRVVVLVVGGVMFAQGMQAIGVIDMLTASVENLSGAGVILSGAFAGATLLLGLISGGGLAMFYATIGLLPGIAAGAGIDGIMIALPMQLIANLVRSISPVAAVIIVVATVMDVNPMKVIKRTSVPIIVGIVGVLVLSFILLPR
ncbi:C4-dicarboxylate transporter DcuC [Culicoidibacter larvae]|uniref:C4-dicarboxylate ABC transporter n=1 Tax=Culicoidibacter larvae TaxID=2579976 RepID=A0A5R8QFL3_9FIRM|nr:C4-dicarboxylate transporter DcuC [Culicoidibacter larvae]TLG76526.1 C4-dicarboxylate ABC transporter [Culicoidibacter larvae]